MEMLEMGKDEKKGHREAVAFPSVVGTKRHGSYG